MRKQSKGSDEESLYTPPRAAHSLPNLLSIENDGLISKGHKESNAAFEIRLRSFLDNNKIAAKAKAEELQASIILAFVRHLNEGLPPPTFTFKLDSGLQIADRTNIEMWKSQRTTIYVTLEEQVELAMKRCESLWIEHLGYMAKGERGGQVKAMEMYMKRFFGWDVDTQGQEEAQAVIAAFAAMGRSFTAPCINIKPKENNDG